LTEPLIEPSAVTPRINEAGVRFDPSLAFDRPELKNLLDIWDALRHGRRMPARADLNLFDLKSHLGHLFLVDVGASRSGSVTASWVPSSRTWSTVT